MILSVKSCRIRGADHCFSGVMGVAVASLLGVSAFLGSSRADAADTSIARKTLHMFDVVSGYLDPATSKDTTLCSPRKTELYIVSDDSSSGLLTVKIDELPTFARHGASQKLVDKAKNTDPLPAPCTGWVAQDTTYTIKKTTIESERTTSQSLVTGILAVPFKFHLSSKSVTAGSTIGGYVGYQTSFFNLFTLTPILGGGLALVDTSPAQPTTSTTSTTPAPQSSGTQSSYGFSVVTGLIGSVSSAAASSGVQFGVLVGLDWLSKTSNYPYEGKPWIAFEIGYNFSQ